MNFRSINVIIAMTGMILIAGCGSGGSGGGATDKTVVVAFSLVSSAQLPARINGVNISAILPVGVTVPMDTVNPKQISATALVAGSAVTILPADGSAVLGSYSSAGRLVRISVTWTGAPQTGFGPGEVARLTCTAAAGTTVTSSELTALNTPLVYFKAVNFDPVTLSTVDMTNFLQPLFTVK